MSRLRRLRLPAIGNNRVTQNCIDLCVHARLSQTGQSLLTERRRRRHALSLMDAALSDERDYRQARFIYYRRPTRGITYVNAPQRDRHTKLFQRRVRAHERRRADISVHWPLPEHEQQQHNGTSQHEQQQSIATCAELVVQLPPPPALAHKRSYRLNGRERSQTIALETSEIRKRVLSRQKKMAILFLMCLLINMARVMRCSLGYYICPRLDDWRDELRRRLPPHIQLLMRQYQVRF